MSKQNIQISQIRKDGGTQSRAAIDQAVVNDYAETIRDGQKLPPIKLFYDGDNYWLADGFHRLAAHEAAGKRVIAADVRQGTQREAVLYSVGANSTHGLRRTNADKRRAVETLLADEEWRQWSDREIARRCGVHHTTVANIRSDMVSSGEISQIENRQVQRGDTVYEQKTTKIGSNPETLYSHEPSDDPVVERARQIALIVIGDSMIVAEDKMRGHSYTGNSDYSVSFGGGNIWLDFKASEQRAEKYAREQVAVVLKQSDGERLFRFNIKKLMEWKLARRDEQITRIDALFTEGDKVKVLPGKFIIFRLDWDGTYKQASDLSFERILGDRLIFGYAFRTNGMELAEVYKYQGGRPYVVNLACLRADSSESKAAIQKGDTVQAKSGQVGTVEFTSGKQVYVDTRNGQKIYNRDNLSVVPPKPETIGNRNTVEFVTAEGIISINMDPAVSWIERFLAIEKRYAADRLLFANISEGAIFLNDTARTVFNLLHEHKDEFEWGNNAVSGVRFWVLLKRDPDTRGIPLLPRLWARGAKGTEYNELMFNRDDLRPLSQVNDVQDGYADKREFETMLAEVNLYMNNALDAVGEYTKAFPDHHNSQICSELTTAIQATRDGLWQLLGLDVRETV